MTFTHPIFVKLGVKIQRAEQELCRIKEHQQSHSKEIAGGEWGAVSALALGVHNVYNGIEDVLQSLANDVDGVVPKGESAHQDLLDQMYGEIPEVRPSVLDGSLYNELTELKGFRHLVRHRYGFDLKADKVIENVERAKRVLPALLSAICALEHDLLQEDSEEDLPKGPGGK